MFEKTRKAFERAQTLCGGHHTPDPEITVWATDFAAAKVALNTIDREIQEWQLAVNTFVKRTLDLYNAFTGVAACDPEVPIPHKTPMSTSCFAPVQEIAGRVKAITALHTSRTSGFLGEIRLQLLSVEDLLTKTDNKKIDCERLAQAHAHAHAPLDYGSASTPEVREYQKYHQHTLRLVPAILEKMQQLTELLLRKQMSYQLEVTGLLRGAINQVSELNKVEGAKDRIEVMQRWSAEIEPVIAQLSKTRTIGSSVQAPQTQQRMETPSLPTAGEAKPFASGVGASFTHGFSCTHETDVRFFNPHRGMFGDITRQELQLASETKGKYAQGIKAATLPYEAAPGEAAVAPRDEAPTSALPYEAAPGEAAPGEAGVAPRDEVPKTSALPAPHITAAPGVPLQQPAITAAKAPPNPNPFRDEPKTQAPVVTAPAPTSTTQAAAPAPTAGAVPAPTSTPTSTPPAASALPT